MAKQVSKKKKKDQGKQVWIRRGILIVCAILAGAAVYLAYRVFGPNTRAFGDKKYFYIRTGSHYADVLEGLKDQDIIRNGSSFDWVAKQLDYPNRVKAGRYQVTRGMSNFDIVKLLRSGRQSPVTLVINKLRTENDLIRKVSLNLEADSNALRAMLKDPVYLRQFGLDTNTAMCAVLPNTYQFYWNTSAEKVFEKFEQAHNDFWTPERKAKATALGLSENEVTILGSIVEEETNANDEKPLISSVYLNRYRKGMALQADPTVKFGLQNFALRRILTEHLHFESPYNTYLHKGLPPGPICTPSVKTLDAVLNTPDTDYLYFCARADMPGHHAFAVTYEEHLKNARLYHAALDARGL